MRKLNAQLIILCFGMSLILTSCHVTLFQEPQPVDSANKKHIPCKFRGTWIAEGDTIVIDRNHYLSINHKVKDIQLNNLKEDEKFLIVSNTLVYHILGNDIKYGKLIFFSDSLIQYDLRTVEEINLDQNNLLRKAGKYHILNRKSNDESQWWQLLLVTKDKDHNLLIKSFSKEDEKFLPAQQTLHQTENETFSTCRWTKKEIQRNIESGMFTDTVLYLERKNKIK